MTVVCLDWERVHLHGAAWISHHRLRYRLFVERQCWEVPSYNGLEYDQFDTPAAKYLLWLDREGSARGITRLIPTTRPYMVKTLWPDLIDGVAPESPSIWEATRFGCDRDLEPHLRRRVVAEMICACQEFGIARGLRGYLGVMPLSIFRQVIAAAGCPLEQLGPVRRLGRHSAAAAYIHVSSEILAIVRRQTGLNGPVLQPPPTLAA
ncbi:MAG: acyl-homoserine-lactone synthase [Kiloniellales bacterium]